MIIDWIIIISFLVYFKLGLIFTRLYGRLSPRWLLYCFHPLYQDDWTEEYNWTDGFETGMMFIWIIFIVFIILGHFINLIAWIFNKIRDFLDGTNLFE